MPGSVRLLQHFNGGVGADGLITTKPDCCRRYGSPGVVFQNIVSQAAAGWIANRSISLRRGFERCDYFSWLCGDYGLGTDGSEGIEPGNPCNYTETSENHDCRDDNNYVSIF